MVTPSPDDVTQLIEQADRTYGLMMAAAVALAFVTGARRGELAALCWSDITLGVDFGSVRIDRSLSQVGGALTEKSTKTGRGRTVSLDACSMIVLESHRRAQQAFSEQCGSPLVPDPYVLSLNANADIPVPPNVLTDRFTVIRKKCGLEGVCFHDLRHAHVTELLSAGVDVTTVCHPCRPCEQPHDARPLRPRSASW